MFWVFLLTIGIPWFGYHFSKAIRTFTGDDTSWRDLKKIQKIDRMLTAMTKDQRREWLANNMEQSDVLRLCFGSWS
jgi:hypothetical protein